MTPVEAVGWVAALVGTVMALPQLVRLIRSRNVEGVSLTTWQLILGLTIGWVSHGIIIGEANMIVSNGAGTLTAVPILFLISRQLGRSFVRLLLPGLLVGAAMIAVDLALGSTAYGIFAIWPALFANLGQGLELVRSPRVVGVSPAFLIASVLNQALWLFWGGLVFDRGTLITATATLIVVSFNLTWWVLRKLGLRSFLVPTKDEVRAYVGARVAEQRDRKEDVRAGR